MPFILLSASFASTQVLSATSNDLPIVNVTADFRDAKVTEIPSSLTVISEQVIEQRSALHLEEILNLAPNVNYASGASRARFYQIRGIGERSQFVEPLNPSVGVIIDDMDFSGLGTAGTLLDVKQVEILRGPQGTRFGASALAGLINLKTADPSENFEGRVESSLSEYDSYSLGAVVSGPLTDALLYRFSAQQNLSDGYIENDYLNRDDTNNRDEQTLRGKLRWLASDVLTVDTNLFYVDVDNGYDGFSLDNTRHTLSDEPGHDHQESVAAGVKATYSGAQAFETQVLASASNTNMEYGYDEDWAYPAICAGQACDGWEYNSKDNYIRNRSVQTAEVRLVSTEDGKLFNGTTDWVAGIYYRHQDEDLEREYTYASQDYLSDYETSNMSVFSQLETHLTDQLTLTAGLRLEQHESDFSDNNLITFDRDEDLWGGRLALEYLLDADTMVYGLVSRGYKTGGVNNNPSLPNELRDYDTEHMLNYEVGSKFSLRDNSLHAQIALFYQQRDDVQVKQSTLVPNAGSSCPCEFIDYQANAAQGNNYGLELELLWQVSTNWQLDGSLGLLNTELKDFVNADGKDLDGREQAHAPAYQFSLGGQYFFTERLSARLEVEGKDKFYFSDNHDEQSDAYELWNANITYDAKDWQLALWGRNLTDEDYQVRGFGGFGNDPRKFYATEPYYQYGEPRIVGVRGSYSF
ncbi:TonB-dependent receptor [Aestuariicella hydrocarbonica]|uniref:TonB-dependent receptor n=1 Tax=Pseudomaricurvus hydrocarbonicus TaxID=1470433 RepID=A0A9E5MHU9_9GAMM|nr:TonB-dependent receptor [Aestuariicella hydrocarbonica]NHO66426.1 TonB-dependent receptor [Aestuariicella hydrocarbonica]